MKRASASPAPTMAAVRLPFASGVADVTLSHGVVWLSFSDEGWPDGCPAAKPWVHRACGPATAAELRALADAVEAAEALRAGG